MNNQRLVAVDALLPKQRQQLPVGKLDERGFVESIRRVVRPEVGVVVPREIGNAAVRRARVASLDIGAGRAAPGDRRRWCS